MRRVIAIIATLISLSAVAGPESVVPATEGNFIVASNEGNMRTNATNSIYKNMAGNCFIICAGAEIGNMVVTDQNILFVSNGKIIKKMSRSKITNIEAASFGFTKGVFIQTSDYESVMFTMNSESQEQILTVLEAK